MAPSCRLKQTQASMAKVTSPAEACTWPASMHSKTCSPFQAISLGHPARLAGLLDKPKSEKLLHACFPMVMDCICNWDGLGCSGRGILHLFWGGCGRGECWVLKYCSFQSIKGTSSSWDTAFCSHAWKSYFAQSLQKISAGAWRDFCHFWTWKPVKL